MLTPRRTPRVLTCLRAVLAAALLGCVPVVATPFTTAAAAATCPASGGVGVAEAAAPAAEVVFYGHGYGHGVGMSQYGMQGAARLGCTYEQILRTYYRGTEVATASMPTQVRLWLLRAGTRADTTVETGSVAWVFRAANATTDTLVQTQPAGQSRRVDLVSGRLRLLAGSAVVWTASSPGTLEARHTGSIVRVVTAGGSLNIDRRLRWDTTRYTADSASRLQAVQMIGASTVDGVVRSAMDKYLFGLAEVPILWPAEALKAQVVAARTYAARKLADPAAVLYPTTQDQYYAGYAQEATDRTYGYPWRSAVVATSGRVVRHSAALANTMYSSSTGGWTEDIRYSFGGAGVPYLTAVDDSRWDAASDNPYRSWTRGFTRAQVAAALRCSSVTSLAVAPRGTDARWQQKVVVTGTGCAKTTWTGNEVRVALGLRAPGFTFRTPLGGPAATPLVGDWDGDGRAEPGWYKDGVVALPAPGGAVRTFWYGTRGDIPVVGDWDGDGTDGIGVVRGGRWYLRNSLTSGVADVWFDYGNRGDLPVAGDWDGDGRDGIAVFRAGTWFFRSLPSGGVGQWSVTHGGTSSRPVVGDWDGDRATGVGAVEGNSWALRASASAGTSSVVTFTYGNSTDRPVAGDWDGDGDVTPGVVRGTTWYLRRSNTSGVADTTVTFAG